MKKRIVEVSAKWTQVNNQFAGEDKAYLTVQGYEDKLSIIADYNKGAKLQDERNCAYHVWYDVELQDPANPYETLSLSTRCLFKALNWVKKQTGN